ncbi:hypothetical protein POPTR_004G124301v4 [Populus trichocarpa]|uniref:Uncharacterized protein n=1 Tax=Populus trichocarpa TaxID=3694 RepID=A0ACC0T4V2_POPTR|nr:hypothetical protein POPTR_004G124301v4 [Populus trichocarpa]
MGLCQICGCCLLGGDPMIRDGRRSVTRDLVRFLEFIDGFAVKRHERSCNSARNVRVLGKSNNARILNAKNDYGGYGNLIENPRRNMRNGGDFESNGYCLESKWEFSFLCSSACKDGIKS